LSCGDCDACCKIFTVDEVDSPKGEYCKYCDKGCLIYETRPDVCKEFKCGYLVGGWEIELRPDNCGVMIRNSSEGYQALRFKDEVNPVILDQIKFIEKKYNVSIKGVDAR